MSGLIFKQGPVLLSLGEVTQSRQTFTHFPIVLPIYYILVLTDTNAVLIPYNRLLYAKTNNMGSTHLYNSTLSPHWWYIMWLLPKRFLDVLVTCCCVHGDQEGFKLKQAKTLKGNCRACSCQMTTLLLFFTMYSLINVKNLSCHDGA